MKPIGVAIVGCGRIADLHQMGYRGREDARIVAVCDVRARQARRRAKAWGVDKVYKDFGQLLEDPAVDLVELLVPHNLHAAMTVAACQAGKHVSVQKPMAMNTVEARQMIRTAEAAGVQLRVYENFVFYPPHVRAKEMIETGEIGEPQMIRMHVSTGKSKTAWKVPMSAWLSYSTFSHTVPLCGPRRRAPTLLQAMTQPIQEVLRSQMCFLCITPSILCAPGKEACLPLYTGKRARSLCVSKPPSVPSSVKPFISAPAWICTHDSRTAAWKRPG